VETVERAPQDSDSDPPPIVLDRYELLEQLGAGGFGTVWLAYDARLEREVAVKRIPIGPHPPLAKRAEREALAAARLSHPAIVALYEAGRDEHAVYLVSELVRGATLADLLREGALSDRDVVEIGVAMCDALAHAHARGVVHRDVKPGNVLVPDAMTEGVPAKLTDFGIARMAGDDALTATGDVVGTLAYMAPEQAEGRGATAATDLYALALVLYEALSGVNPVRSAGAAATARNVGMRLPPLRRLRRDLPRGLCAALDAAVLSDPAMRGSIPSLREALAHAAGEVGDEPGTVEASAWAAEPAQTAVSTAREWLMRPAVPEDETQTRLGLPRIPIPARVVHGACSGAMVAALIPFAASGQRLDTAAAAALSAAAAALLPRLGYVLVATALALYLAASDAPGVALVVGAATLPMLVLVPRRAAWWSSPALAIVLGLAGVAGAWPAVAGQARGLLGRAALGALGFWWLALAELIRHDRLLTGPEGAARPGATEAARGLGAILTAPTLAIAGLWALGAALLPLLVRGRNAALDLLAAAGWAAALALAAKAVTDAAGVAEPRGLVGAAALAALLAVGAQAIRRA
jgi:hypothetical protein